MENNYTEIPIVNKMTRILSLVLNSKHGLSSSEIKKDTPDIPKTTLYRLLKSLTDNGYLKHNESKNIYTAGRIFITTYSSIDEKAARMRQLANPYLKSLAETHHGTVKLSVLSGYKAYTVSSVECSDPIRVSIHNSATFPLHAGASGKILMTVLTEEEIKNYFDTYGNKYTENTITSMDEMMRVLQEIKERGYSIDNGEYMPEIYAVATPVYDENNNIVATVSISFPSSNNIYEANLSNLVKSLKEASELIRDTIYNSEQELQVTLIKG